jgi:hypothetical protein
VEELQPGCVYNGYGYVGACTIATLGGGFSEPRGVAVDGSGNVFVTDETYGLTEMAMSSSGTAL